MKLGTWLPQRTGALEAFLEPRFDGLWPATFAEPLRYPVFGGGKRVRPALVFAAHEAVTGQEDPAPALAPAAAVELVHTYSLVHDDLPAMDDDAVRRGRPTVHVAFDEATAILVGDGLLTEAFAVLAQADLPAEARIAMVARLATAAGARGMVAGQVADMQRGTPNLQTVTRTHAQKTGALITASCVLGGIAGGASAAQRSTLEAIGAAIGLAFQLTDDCLDAAQDADAKAPSFVRLLGLDQTRQRAQELADEAVARAQELQAPDALIALARFSIARSV